MGTVVGRDFFRRVFQQTASVFTAMRAALPYLFGISEPYRQATEEYPDRVSARMPEDMPQRFRGLIVNDIEKCSGCRFCAEECPVDCIRIETEPGPTRNVNWTAVFDVDHARCMFCGLCVEVCPTGSLQHTKEYRGAVFRVNDLISSFGRGWATKDLRDRWLREQRNTDLRANEYAELEKSPVGAELRRVRGESDGNLE